MLRELVVSNRQQERFGLPTVPDVAEMMLRRDDVKTFRVNLTTQVITTSTTVPTAGAYSFTLNALNNAAEFTSLFDQYRLVQVVAEFYPDNNTEGFPIYTVIDYDDAATPASEAIMQEYSTLQTTSAASGYFQRVLNPRAAIAAYSGAFTSFASAPRSMWMDVASPSIQYYGLKYFIPITASANFHVRIAFKSVWQFRQNR